MALVGHSNKLTNLSRQPTQGDYEESFGQSKSNFSALETIPTDGDSTPLFSTQKNPKSRVIDDPSSAQTAKFKNESNNADDLKFTRALAECFEDSDNKFKARRKKTGEFASKKSEESHNVKKDNNRGAVLIEIAITPKQIETISYHEGDSVKEKAVEFCNKFGLDESMAEIIERAINANLAQIKKKKKLKQMQSSDETQSKNVENANANEGKTTNKKENKGKPAIIIELDLGDSTDKIYAFENDDPNVLAARFCEKHNLNEEAQPFLAKNIAKQMKKFKKATAPKEYSETDPSSTEKENSELHTIQEASRPLEASELQHEMAYSRAYDYWHHLAEERDTIKQKSQKTDTQTSRSLKGRSYSPLESRRKSPDAVFNKLYYQGLLKKREKDQKKAAYEQEVIEKEKKDCTFTPDITPLNPGVLRNRSHSPIYEPKRYYEELQKLSNRQKALEEERKKALFEVCTFKPKIPESSQQILSQKTRHASRDIHTRLYKEADVIAKKRDEFVEEGRKDIYTFKPEINQTSRQLTQQAKESQKEHIERLLKEAKDKQGRHMQAKMTSEAGANQRLFHPTVTHDKYYQKRKEKDDEHYQIALDPATLKVKRLEPSQKNTETKNSEVYQDTAIRAIFNALDGDRDGLITSENVDLCGLDVKIIKVLSEVLYLLEETFKKGMTYEQFEYQVIKRGLVLKLTRLLNRTTQSEQDETTLSEDKSAKPGVSRDISVQINSLDSVIEKIHSDKSPNRSVSHVHASNFGSIISNNQTDITSDKSTTTLTPKYQKILSKKAQQ